MESFSSDAQVYAHTLSQNMKHFISIFFLVNFCTAGICFSQSFHTKSNKALKIYNEGVNAFDYFDLNKAEILFKEAISIDREFYEAYMMLGELMSKQRRYSEAAMNFRYAVKLDSMFFKPVFFSGIFI